MATTSPPSRCQTGTGHGFGRTFLKKDTPGLCKKCVLLSALTDGTSEFTTIM
ncbi:hypothetical protein H0H81_003650, partial [Sphagnurus paluster]